MKRIQFIETSPQKLKEEIGEEIKKQLDTFLKDFKPKQPDDYLTRREVAELFKVNISTIFQWSKKGTLKPVGINGRVYFLRSDIEKSLKPLND